MTVRAGAFEALLCTRVLSHVADLAAAVAGIVRALAPGGLAILADVDAAHDYDETRLPSAAGCVAAHTFKHTRAAMQSALETAGLTHRRSRLILRDGSSTPLDALGEGSTSTPVGWVTAWIRTG